MCRTHRFASKKSSSHQYFGFSLGIIGSVSCTVHFIVVYSSNGTRRASQRTIVNIKGRSFASKRAPTILVDPRRWDNLVRKPLAVGDCALSLDEASNLLQAVGVPSPLIAGIFDIFARRKNRSNCWSRAVGGVPERRVDALELFAGLTLTCRATVQEKLSIIFSLFDCRETGILVEDDLGALISSCASFLCRLGLSIPISNDEAAFVAGGVFALAKEPVSSRMSHADEISLPEFMLWARQAKLPIHAMELLSLPHRLSGALDLVSDNLGLLRERYAMRRSTRNCSKPTGQPHRDNSTPSRRASRFLSGNGIGGRSLSFTLPPVMYRVSSHHAKVLLEASPTGAPTATGSIWHAVVTIEERSGSRFAVIDSQPVTLRGGVPTFLAFSALFAATDHRVQLSWNIYKPQRQRAVERRKVWGGEHGRRTLRFTTLSEHSANIENPQGQMGAPPTFPPGRKYDTHPRQSIRVTTANDHKTDTNIFGSYTPPPSPTDTKDTTVREKSSTGRRVSVVISHQQPTSLELIDERLDMKLWWAIPTPTSTGTTSDTDPSATLSPPHADWSLTRTANPESTALSSAGVAPFNGENSKVQMSGEPQRLCWAAGGSSSSDIDVMIHLIPNWQAKKSIRRCFHILEEGRYESSAIREDGRNIVALEVTKAIRSLFHKTCQLQRRTPSDPGRKCCAHVVFGVPHPWLGLHEVRFVLWIDLRMEGDHRLTFSNV